MNLDHVAKLARPDMSRNTQSYYLHGAVGVATEAGELLDKAKKHAFYDQPIDRENLIEELGDLMFYAEMLREYTGCTWAQIVEYNRQKLQQRYPQGFTTKAAKERLDKSGN